MRDGYQGLSMANRLGCLAAVVGTLVAIFVLFANFMADFAIPSGSLMLEVVLPAFAIGIALFLFVGTIVGRISRKVR